MTNQPHRFQPIEANPELSCKVCGFGIRDHYKIPSYEFYGKLEKKILSPTARTLIKQAKQEERSTLKAQVRKEIEGKLEAVGLCENTKKDSSWCNKCRECHLRGSDLNLGREEAFEDCLSIPSLKGEE